MTIRRNLYAGALILAALGISLVSARRDVLQVAVSAADSGNAADYYDYQSEADVEVCYPSLQVLLSLNQTYDIGTFIEGLAVTSIYEFLEDPLQLQPTVFAPTDAAFDAAAKSLNFSTAELLSSPLLFPLLLYHIVPDPVLVEDLMDGSVLPTLLGENLTVTSMNGTQTGATTSDGVSIDVVIESPNSEAVIIVPDICNCEFCTSVVHIIDEFLLPEILNYSIEGDGITATIGNGRGGNFTFVLEVEGAAAVNGTALSPDAVGQVASPAGAQTASAPSSPISQQYARTTSKGYSFSSSSLTD